MKASITMSLGSVNFRIQSFMADRGFGGTALEERQTAWVLPVRVTRTK
jgi:hypothetical protein